MAAFVIHHPWWPTVAVSAFVPHVEWSSDYVLNIVAVLGTTITPYCFFWQADQEVEEDYARGRMQFYGKGVPVLHDRDIRNMRTDTAVGMGFSNVVQFFIILTCASTLHQAGVFNVDTPDQAAAALRPLAGDFTFLLFAIGIVGVGFLAVPTLTGSASYALSEALGWKAGLGYTFRQARAFYVVIAVATIVGVGLNFIGIPPFRMLYYAAAVNGVLAPPLMALITLVGNNRSIMGQHVNNRFANIMGWAIVVIMGACAQRCWGHCSLVHDNDRCAVNPGDPLEDHRCGWSWINLRQGSHAAHVVVIGRPIVPVQRNLHNWPATVEVSRQEEAQ
ncbi:NRAMP family divalent metal transporter [Mycolicibacterium aubagnense]|uniref:NRAMP family divalent metal transporter n=1 Tax=Mycolicibacterium aubagnense TaxID=319707 RepID=UPI0013CF803B|nr:divalent metal cation transporter [Mycolicibacterium aubagnense]